MLTHKQILGIARARLDDAKALIAAGRYDGAVYLCGYAVEMALKARIVKTLKWSGFPETPKEFEDVKALKVHAFHVLLRFTGREGSIVPLPEWLVVQKWSPDNRYKPAGTVTPAEAILMLNSATTLMRHL